MTATSIQPRQRPCEPPRRISTHLFALGQAVRLRSSLGRFPKTAEIYHITGKLPPTGQFAAIPHS